FATPGTYTVTLTVTDSRGLSDPSPATRTITVAAQNLLPLAVLSLLPSTGNAPLITTADGSSSSDPDGSVTGYRFDFGDGVAVGPDTTRLRGHTYAAGTYTARLTVTDNRGAAQV